MLLAYVQDLNPIGTATGWNPVLTRILSTALAALPVVVLFYLLVGRRWLASWAGAASPVAICGAMLVGLGMPPFRAAVICLIANTSPVCYGGLGVPILTLESSSGVSADKISIMCGHQLPFLSCLVPLYMVKTMCTWRQTLAIWPALLVGGGSFAVFQFFFATAHAYGLPPIWPLTDIAGSALSMITLALFLKFVWKPKQEWKFPEEARSAQRGVQNGEKASTADEPDVRYAKEEVESLLKGPEL